MSADLELPQELLEIRLPPGEMSTSSEKASSQSSEITDDGIRTSSTTGSSSSSSSSSSSTGEELQQNCQTPKTGSEKGSTSKGGEGGESGQQCRTPSSPGNMIPVILSCPPAPKKQRTSAVSCKRKLVFFDQVVARDEIDSFFRQFAIDVNSKRRCLV